MQDKPLRSRSDLAVNLLSINTDWLVNTGNIAHIMSSTSAHEATTQELDVALETLQTLRGRHADQLSAAAYGVLIGACAARGRGVEGVDLFGVFRLDASCSGAAAMQATPFLYW